MTYAGLGLYFRLTHKIAEIDGIMEEGEEDYDVMSSLTEVDEVYNTRELNVLLWPFSPDNH
ncbi:MAG: hypothetical protein ACQES0_08810 [Bacteroidota bacterium]